MDNSTIVIETNSGPVRGIKRTTILGDDYLSFQSIPYAEPPVGSLRFRVISKLIRNKFRTYNLTYSRIQYQ